MTYNTVELSKVSGFSVQTVTRLLRDKGYSPIGTGEYNRYEWQEDCLEYLLKHKNQLDKKDTVLIGTLASRFRITNQTVREILSGKGIEPLGYREHAEVYPIIARDILTEHFDSTKTEDEELHPLVTDKKWLKLNNWPDTVPRCFEDLED